MNIKTELEYISKLLEEAKIPSAIIGGLAVGALGYERFTNDIDLLVSGEHRESLKKMFLKNGFIVFSENNEFIQFEGREIPVDIMFANRPVSQSMLRHARIVPGLAVKCLSAEAIIGLKIQSYATNPKRTFKDKADISALIERHDLNWNEVKAYADVFDKWTDIQEIRGILGK